MKRWTLDGVTKNVSNRGGYKRQEQMQEEDSHMTPIPVLKEMAKGEEGSSNKLK